MNHALTESNVVFVYGRRITDILTDALLETYIKEETGDQDQIVKASIGDSRRLVSTSGYVQVNIKPKSVVIASARINETEEYSNRPLANIAFRIAKHLKDQGIENESYGCNFVLTFDETDYASQVNMIKDKYFKDEVFSGQDEELKFAYPSFRIQKGDCTLSFSYNSVDLDNEIQGVKKIVAIGNVHFDHQVLRSETSSDFHEIIKSQYSGFFERMNLDD